MRQIRELKLALTRHWPVSNGTWKYLDNLKKIISLGKIPGLLQWVYGYLHQINLQQAGFYGPLPHFLMLQFALLQVVS